MVGRHSFFVVFYKKCKRGEILLKKQSKKMVAPIIITILAISYFLFYMWTGFAVGRELPFIVKILVVAIPIGFIILMISLLVERIKEIKEDDEDDLSKY